MSSPFNGKFSAMLLGVLLIVILVVWGSSNRDQETLVEPQPSIPAAEPKEEELQVTYTGELSPLVQQKCFACHAVDGQKVERISDVRKSPEGWGVTLSRMQRAWGLQLTDEEKKQLVFDLSKTNGLAPSEMEAVMYWLTKKGSQMEAVPNDSLTQTCIRCHGIGQPLAQRRTAEEWENLKDFHVAFNPSMIYQLRDVDWDEVAGAAIDYLKENYPYENPDYEQWRKDPSERSPEGKWKIVGFMPGKGMYTGTSVITKVGDDEFKEERSIHMGEQEIKHQSHIARYSGYALRSSMDGTDRFKGYYNISSQKNTITGTRVKVGDNGIYADETYYAADAKRLVDVWPRSVRKGEVVTLHVASTDLPEQIELESIKTDASLEVLKIVQQDGGDLWIEAKAKEIAEKAKVTIEQVEDEVAINIYQQVDYIKISPDYGRGRIAYGDQQESVQFKAEAYANGADGKAETEDDAALGWVDVKWVMKEHEQFGIDDHDVHFIGQLDPDTGLFTPAVGGPNEKREWQTNNAGGVKIEATYTEPGTGRVLKDDAFLLNTVPDFVLPIH